MKKNDPNSPFCQRWLPRKKAAALIGVTVRAMEDWPQKYRPEFFKRNARVGGYHLMVIEGVCPGTAKNAGTTLAKDVSDQEHNGVKKIAAMTIEATALRRWRISSPIRNRSNSSADRAIEVASEKTRSRE